MARVTVEDCVLQVPNRFELVMLSAHRARALAPAPSFKSNATAIKIRSSLCAKSPNKNSISAALKNL